MKDKVSAPIPMPTSNPVPISSCFLNAPLSTGPLYSQMLYSAAFVIYIPVYSQGHSPRLGANTAALVNVKDNDDANGVFSFKTTSIKVPENATSGNTRTVQLTIQRTGGTLGAVSVIVRTIGGGEPWDKDVSPKELKDELTKRPKDANATVGNDYNKLEQRVDFNVSIMFFLDVEGYIVFSLG